MQHFTSLFSQMGNEGGRFLILSISDNVHLSSAPLNHKEMDKPAEITKIQEAGNPFEFVALVEFFTSLVVEFESLENSDGFPQF